MFDKLKKKIGETIVDGTADAAKTKLVENRDDLIETAIAVGICAILVVGGIRLVTPPRVAVSKLHIYVHVK